MKVLAVCKDMIFRSKMREAGGTTPPQFVKTIPEAEAFFAENTAEVCVFDLDCISEDLHSFISSLPSSVRTIAFGSHIETEKLAAAAKAGVKEVVPRSKFVAILPTLFT